MIIILLRTLILYLLVLISLRVMGKGELSQMQPLDLVVTLMIAELAALPMEDTKLPLLNGFISILALLFIQVSISFITLKSEKARALVCGKPSILISKGQINEQELKKLRININDLIEMTRSKDYYNISDVEFAILETNGDLSIIPKSNKRNITLEDMNITGSYESLPVTLILDGHINDDNLNKIHRSRTWLANHLKKEGITTPKQVFLCYLDSNNKVYIQKKDKYKV